MPPTDAAELPATVPDAVTGALRAEIDRLDDEILSLIRQRSELSQKIGAARLAAGGTKIVYSREMVVLQHYGQLGREGREIALQLLRLGRGPLGR